MIHSLNVGVKFSEAESLSIFQTSESVLKELKIKENDTKVEVFYSKPHDNLQITLVSGKLEERVGVVRHRRQWLGDVPHTLEISTNDQNALKVVIFLRTQTTLRGFCHLSMVVFSFFLHR